MQTGAVRPQTPVNVLIQARGDASSSKSTDRAIYAILDGPRRKSGHAPAIIISIALNVDPDLLSVLAVNLLQSIRPLRDLVEIGDNSYSIIVSRAELTNRHGLSGIVVLCPKERGSGVKLCKFHHMYLLKKPVAADSHRFGGLGTIFTVASWDRYLRSGRVHVTQNVDQSHCRIRADMCDFFCCGSRFHIIRKQLSNVSDKDISGDCIAKRMQRILRPWENVNITNFFVCVIHLCEMDFNQVFVFDAKQCCTMNVADDLPGLRKKASKIDSARKHSTMFNSITAGSASYYIALHLFGWCSRERKVKMTATGVNLIILKTLTSARPSSLL